MKPDYHGFVCDCGAWSSFNSPKETEICYEGSVMERGQIISEKEIKKKIKEKNNGYFK